jgi:hypothetical protein
MQGRQMTNSGNDERQGRQMAGMMNSRDDGDDEQQGWRHGTNKHNGAIFFSFFIFHFYFGSIGNLSLLRAPACGCHVISYI